jgi:hypothetical protein
MTEITEGKKWHTDSKERNFKKGQQKATQINKALH